MPSFGLAVATAVLTLYGCFSCTVSICSREEDERGSDHPYPASSTGYGSITTQPAHRPLPSPSYPRDRHIPSKPTVKTPLIPDHRDNSPHPTRTHIHISQQPGPSRPPVVPRHTAALAVRTHHFLRVPAPADLLPHLSTSSHDPHARNEPRERETIRRAPLASRSNLSVPQFDKGQNVERIITGEDIRKRARCRKDEMEKANKLADHARRGGNHDARVRHERDALVHKSAMESLYQAAARLTFKEKNKVRLLSCRES